LRPDLRRKPTLSGALRQNTPQNTSKKTHQASVIALGQRNNGEKRYLTAS